MSLNSTAVCFYSSNAYTWGSQTYKLMSRVPVPLLAPCYFNETDSGTDKIFILSLFLFSLNIFFFISHPIQLEPFNMSTYAPSHSLTFTFTLRPTVQCYPTCLLVTLIAVINLMPWNPSSVSYSHTYGLPILINVNRKIDEFNVKWPCIVINSYNKNN